MNSTKVSSIYLLAQYYGKKLQLNLLGGAFFLKKFNKRGILIRNGGGGGSGGF